MNTRKTVVAAAVTASAAVLGAALALPAVAGGADDSHTIHFVAQNQISVGLGKHGGATVDKDVNHGKLVGVDLLSFTGQSSADVALALPGGLLLATLEFSKSGALTGTVTGGTGAYADISGTVTGMKTGKRTTDVTVTYH
jgi:hypothetical protein